MDSKLILKLTDAVCKGICSTQTLAQHIREAANVIHQIYGNNIPSDQVRDLELSCLILSEYLKSHPGAINLKDAVGELVKELNDNGLAVHTTKLHDKSFSTTSLIRGGQDIKRVFPKI
ncbi:MAG: hypothetical protein IJJ83_11000 [Muribaculaceae bacterium]|jgi:hypothetical protein|nr:hypothetical protein [Muribaculaceae bacterium]